MAKFSITIWKVNSCSAVFMSLMSGSQVPSNYLQLNVIFHFVAISGSSSIFANTRQPLSVSTAQDLSMNRQPGPLTSTSSLLNNSSFKEKEKDKDKDKDIPFEFDIKDTAPNPSLSPVQVSSPCILYERVFSTLTDTNFDFDSV